MDTIRIFNVHPSPIDARDKQYEIKNVRLEPEIDLRKWDSPVEDQGSLGSCASHAFTSCYEQMVIRQSLGDFVELSRLFSYYNSRILEESVGIDAGILYMRNVIKSGVKEGTCKESLWPYTVSNFATTPSAECYTDALNQRVDKYETLNTVTEALDALNIFKPIFVGMQTFYDFILIDSKNPDIPIPDNYSYKMGNHAVAIVGYNLTDKKFIVKNSFGKYWGDNGYCYMPFAYYDDYVFEKWIFSPIIK